MIDSKDEGRLATVDAYGLIGAASEPELDAIVADAAASAGAPMSMISVVGRERQWFAAATGIDHRETGLADSICAHAIRADGPFIVPDLSADPRFATMMPVREDDGIRFYAGVPLEMRDGSRLGTLCVIDVVPRHGLDPEEQEALTALARRTVAAIELRRDLREGASGTKEALVRDAAAHLVAARAALERAGCTAPLAHLEQVIVLLDGHC